MDVVINTLGILSAVATISGFSVAQVISYYRKNSSKIYTPKTSSPSQNISHGPLPNNKSDKITLSFALLIGISISLFSVYMITALIRTISYFPFPVDKANFPSIRLLLAINFTDPRFDVALVIGIIAGIVTGAWMVREAIELLFEYRKLHS